MAATLAANNREPTPDLDAAVSGKGLHPLFQPIVSLADSRIVGYEALARWPGLGAFSPETVFEYAAQSQRVTALDHACITAAAAAALQAGLPRGCMLAVNCEPASLYVPRSNAILSRAASEFSMVFELTERGLLANPAALLSKVEAMRADGFAVALDDVGAHADSLALLDVVKPEVVKLDWNLIHNQTRRHQSQTLAAVLAYQERSGAVVVAEGIETDAHLERALAVGADLGQGYKFGRPGVLTARDLDTVAPWTVGTLRGPDHFAASDMNDSPFDRAVREPGVSVRTARKEILTAFSRHIERQAADTVDPAMVFAAVQDSRNLTVHTLRRYAGLARTAPLAAIFGRDMTASPAPGVRGVHLDVADRLCREWSVVTLGPRTASALIARECDPTGPFSDESRLFDFVLTFDRHLVAAMAHLLLLRIESGSPPPTTLTE
ncbi:sensor domain-containing phosphodiesterase [Mycolicibacterium sp. A43C]